MDNTLFNRYALALLSVAKEENKVEEYRLYLKEIKEALDNNPTFIKLLGATNIKKSDRYLIIEKVFAQYDSNIVNFIKVILKNNRSYYLRKIIKETIFRFDDYLNIEEGKLISAAKLSEEQIHKIEKALEKTLQKRIELRIIVDESLIGGFKVYLKNDVYDASILRKVHNLKKKLLNIKEENYEY